MWMTSKRVRAGLLVLGGLVSWAMPPARAQMGMPGAGVGFRSLGGYGASTVASYYGGGSSGTSYVPYNGNMSGFIPYRGGAGGGLGLGAQPIARRSPETAIGGASMAQTPIGGASLSGAMGGIGRDMGGGTTGGRRARRTLVPFGYEGGIGMGGMTTAGGVRMGKTRKPIGPGFEYPFRTPMNLGGGSSMIMP